MKYSYHYNDPLEAFYALNNITKEDLDTSCFVVDKDDIYLNNFKEKLLSLKDKKFLIVGDYDCDGICSCAIMIRLLEHLNIKHNFMIPSRNKDGYGLNKRIIDIALEYKFEVILAVDNGIALKDALDYAKSLNIKVLIIDHHEYKEEPDCFGYIHPKLLKDAYNNLSAGGLCKLVSSLFYKDDLATVYGGLATLGDMVGVLGYNRYLLKETIRLLNEKNIYQINLLNGKDVYDYDDLSFNVIPKINSISRMEYNPNILVKYLLADEKTCLKSIESINKVNEERKNITSKLSKNVNQYIIKNEDIVVLCSEELNEGICGLLANRLIHTFNKPIIVLAKKDGVLKGSCRSLEGFSIFEYLSHIKDLFTSFGGHEQACGITLNEDKLDDLLDYINKHKVTSKELIKDVLVINNNNINYELLLKIESLKPFGVDLKEPLLVLKDLKYQKKLVVASKYPKFIINDKVSAISFKQNFLNKDFSDMIGYIRKDNYCLNKASFIIEDLL